MRPFATLSFAICAVSSGTAAVAQSPIPLRSLGPILATSTENVGAVVSVRATSDGHVMVGAASRQRVYAFDSTLAHFTLVVDSGAVTGAAATRTGLMPYLGDSTLMADVGAQSLVVIDPAGKRGRSIAPPHAQDMGRLGLPTARYGLDPKGRLVYRSGIPAPQPKPATPGSPKMQMTPMTADSAPILRGDFDARTVDTVTWVRTPSQGQRGTEIKPNPAGGPATVSMLQLDNPFPRSDEWALLSDGTIAVVRAQDYHIDWVDPDGSRRSSPKMPFDWRAISDSERTERVDDVKSSWPERKAQNERSAAASAGGASITFDFGIVPDSEFPRFWPPITPGSVLADLDGRLWILPATSADAGHGFIYDVVNRMGQIVERVQLPKDYVLRGFGAHHMVYLTKTDGKSTYLARAVFGGLG